MYWNRTLFSLPQGTRNNVTEKAKESIALIPEEKQNHYDFAIPFPPPLYFSDLHKQFRRAWAAFSSDYMPLPRKSGTLGCRLTSCLFYATLNWKENFNSRRTCLYFPPFLLEDRSVWGMRNRKAGGNFQIVLYLFVLLQDWQEQAKVSKWVEE